MHSFTKIVITSKREREVAYTATNSCTGQIVMYPLRGTDKVQSIPIMLTHTRSDGQHIGIKYNISRR